MPVVFNRGIKRLSGTWEWNNSRRSGAKWRIYQQGDKRLEGKKEMALWAKRAVKDMSCPEGE